MEVPPTEHLLRTKFSQKGIYRLGGKVVIDGLTLCLIECIFKLISMGQKKSSWWKFFIQFQNIVFKEYLPVIVGPQMIEEYDLKIDNGQTKYNPEQDPSVSNEFATVSSFAIDKCHSRIHTL